MHGSLENVVDELQRLEEELYSMTCTRRRSATKETLGLFMDHVMPKILI